MRVLEKNSGFFLPTVLDGIYLHIIKGWEVHMGGGGKASGYSKI